MFDLFHVASWHWHQDFCIPGTGTSIYTQSTEVGIVFCSSGRDPRQMWQGKAVPEACQVLHWGVKARGWWSTSCSWSWCTTALVPAHGAGSVAVIRNPVHILVTTLSLSTPYPPKEEISIEKLAFVGLCLQTLEGAWEPFLLCSCTGKLIPAIQHKLLHSPPTPGSPALPWLLERGTKA